MLHEGQRKDDRDSDYDDQVISVHEPITRVRKIKERLLYHNFTTAVYCRLYYSMHRLWQMIFHGNFYSSSIYNAYTGSDRISPKSTVKNICTVRCLVFNGIESKMGVVKSEKTNMKPTK